MKRLFSIISIAVLLSLATQLQAVPVYNLISGVTTEKDAPIPHVINVEPLSNGYKITVNIEEVALNEDEVYTGRYFVDIEGFFQTTEAGTPSFPVRSEIFPIEAGMTPKLALSDYASSDISAQLAPSRPPRLQTGDEYTTATLPDITPFSGFTTNKLAEIEDYFMYRGKSFMSVRFCPIRYSQATSKIRVAKKMVYTLTFNEATTPAEAPPTSNINFSNWKTDGFWANTHASDEYLWTNAGFLLENEDISKDYLIITTEELYPSAETFVEWKKHEGYNCTILTVDGLTADQIKEEIVYFASSHPKLYALLIIGDSTIIPAFRMPKPNIPFNPKNEFLSDMPYCCLDGLDDMYPDIIYGRIPAISKVQANNAIAKIIAYEKLGLFNSPTYMSTIHRGLFVGLFEPGVLPSAKNKESAPHILTCEKIISNLANINLLPTRLYHAEDSDKPLMFYGRTFIPKELQKPNFTWSFTPSDLAFSLNQKGANFILYFGHGNETCWSTQSDPLFSIDNFSLLNNHTWQPVSFSAACLIGKDLLADTFAAKFLNVSATTGVSGIMATTREVYTPYADYCIEKIINMLYQLDSSILSSVIWPTIGDAISFGTHNYWLNNLSNPCVDLQRKVFHWFGDPTMHMPTQDVTKFLGIAISSNTITTTVTCNDEDALITGVYSSGKVETYKGRKATLKTFGCKYVTFTGQNKIPRTIDLGDVSDSEQTSFMALRSAFYRNNQLTVNFSLGDPHTMRQTATLTVASMTGDIMDTFQCTGADTQLIIDCSLYPQGAYIVSLKSRTDDGGYATFIK